MFAFSYPWIFALLPLPWLVRVFFPARQTGGIAVRVPFGARLSAVMQQQGAVPATVRKTWKLMLPALIWLLVL
ncbi:MAG TPA: hypothetical protein DCM07_07610, partial [Planctomycetaceae bacterium]|nr:hypothetical protein [Planctomycetaceae bacterium]